MQKFSQIFQSFIHTRGSKGFPIHLHILPSGLLLLLYLSHTVFIIESYVILNSVFHALLLQVCALIAHPEVSEPFNHH